MFTSQQLLTDPDWIWPARFKDLMADLQTADRILIDAGPGTGKTAFCAAGFEAQSLIYQAFESQAPNGELLAYALALQWGVSPQSLLSAGLFDIHELVSAWCVDSRRILVLDQVQRLVDAAGLTLVHQLLQITLPGFCLVLCSRRFPSQLQLSPLLAGRQLVVISQADLLWQVKDIEVWPPARALSQERREQLWTLSGGVIGLMQAWLSCWQQGLEHPLLQPAYRQLMDQANGELPDCLRVRLPEIATLNSLLAEEMSLLLSAAQIQRLLPELHQWHLIDLDSLHSHPQLLPGWRDYLHKGLEPKALKQLRTRFIALSLEQGRYEAALSYAFANGGYQDVMKVLAVWNPDAMNTHMAKGLMEWIHRQPDASSLLMKSPRLYIFALWGMFLTEQENMYRDFQKLLKAHPHVVEQTDDTRSAVRFGHWVSYFHAWQAAMNEDSDSALMAYQQALSFSQDQNNPLHLKILLGLAGEYFFQSRWQECLDCLEKVMNLSHLQGQDEKFLNARIKMARTRLMMGDFELARHHYQQALQDSVSQSLPIVHIFCLTDLAWIALLQLETVSSQALLQKLLCERPSELNLEWLYVSRCLDLELLNRNFGRAGDLLAALQELVDRMPKNFSRDYQTRRLWLLVETWQLEAAEALLAEMGDLNRGVEALTSHHQNLVWYSILTRYLLRQKRYSEAFFLNHQLLETATTSGTRLYQRVFEAIQEVIRYRLGHQKEQALNRFLLLLEALLRDQLPGILLYAGPEVLPLLHEVRQHFVQTGREAQLDQLKKMFPEAHILGNEISLTPREQALLQLLAEDLSYQEIANRAGVSINTAKTQLKGLYKKLGASKRRDTLLKAQAAWLI
jgi:DNA-binding CsgD family transcriptional regulator/tetratricopeptide (TPR) repeat protein